MLNDINRRPNLDCLEDVFDEGLIYSIKRHMPSGVWDETSFYTVRFSDGTTRNFYEANDILAFANCLMDFVYGREN